ncbi:MAG TPA: aminotransferase class III-fold pyridoxal phosphate-dependent enzyme, partial [Candidatus Angelobacter sp.]|nr:aminotransferase class III-fold pyridoxal phosphate-dependent enzyme [Candidatus Angelobacter sp.]
AKALEGSAHAPFLHAQTYGGHAVACAVGRQVLTAMREEGIEARVREMEPGLEEALQPLGRHRAVGEVRGMGFLRGVILHDRDAEEPFPRELRMAERVEARCRDRGLLVYGGWGSVDGERGDHLLVAPPLTAEPHHFNQIATTLRQALDEVLREARSELES